jgi:hypothetical protein
MNRRGNLTERIIADENLNASFDYVMRGDHKKRSRRGRKMLNNKQNILDKIRNIILNDSFHINGYYEKIISERGKERKIQCVSLEIRVLLHAVMEVVEAELTPVLIADTAASIKGRGIHYLHERIYRNMRDDPDGTKYTYMADIRKCYESVPQEKLIEVVERYISDTHVLYILRTAIRMTPKGVSIGLRTSQMLVNLYFSHYLDHPLKRLGCKYYARYCDNLLIQAPTTYLLTKYIRFTHEAVKKAELSIKPDEQIFETSKRFVDALGYKTNSDGRVMIRNATKKRFARKWKRVKSFKRRQQLIGSFYGITKHANAKHLFKTITGISMKQFSELGLTYERTDGKTYFDVPCVQMNELTNCRIEVHDFTTGAKTVNGDRCIVLIMHEGQKKKFITGSDELVQLLTKAKNNEMLPFETVIVRRSIGNGKYKFSFT